MKATFKFNSLQKKIILYIVVAIALCAIVSSFIVNLVIEFQMTDKYGSEKEAAIESLSYALTPILNSYSSQQVEQLIRSSLIYENIAYIAVYDGSGTLVESDNKDEIANEDLEIERHDITSDGKTIGSFEIGFSKVSIDELTRRTTLIIVAALLAFLFLAGLILFIFVRNSIIHPIEAFTGTVRKMGPDNLSARVNVQTEDEIGMLAVSFNRMAEDLEKSHTALHEARNELERKVELRTEGERRRSDQLRAINEVGRRISAILSLDELLPYVASSLQKTFNYYNVNIFLLESDINTLVLKAGAGGYQGPVPIGYSIRISEGIVGSVAELGDPLNINDVTREPRYILFQELSNTRSELAVPIKIAAEVLGVLDIQSIEPDAFDEIDLFTVQTLGDQLAIAIENARLYQETRDMAVLEERNRMAREIHDTLAQGFTGIVLQLEAAEQALDGNVEQVQIHLNRARELARESLNEARRSVWALRPQALEKSPLETILRERIKSFTRDSGVPSVFNIFGEKRPLNSDMENAILRIYQESLTNIRKHARASQVQIELTFEDENIILRIEDNGIGFNPEAPVRERYGLVSMRERVKLLGGLMKIASEKGKGTFLEATIPFDGGKA